MTVSTGEDVGDRLVDAGLFKLGMRRLVASVCVITSGPHGARVGLTATAVCSVSADPPTLLCCVNRTSASYATILSHGAFAVNVLSEADMGVADVFSTKTPSEQKFDDRLWSQGRSPVLRSAFVSFDCRIARHVETGTHGIMFGEVEAVTMADEAGRPLVYGHGGYGAFLVADA